MHFLLGDGIGIAFILLGLFLLLSGVKREDSRNKLTYSGVGAIVVGFGNMLLLRIPLLGMLALAAGLFLILTGARTRTGQ